MKLSNEKERLQKISLNLKRQEVESINSPTLWIDLTERTFDFAFYAYKRFREVDLHGKKERVSFIGSNFQIKDKKLLFETSKWLIPIEKRYPGLYEEFQWLELNKMLDYKSRNAVLSSIRLRWCWRRDSNPQALRH